MVNAPFMTIFGKIFENSFLKVCFLFYFAKHSPLVICYLTFYFSQLEFYQCHMNSKIRRQTHHQIFLRPWKLTVGAPLKKVREKILGVS